MSSADAVRSLHATNGQGRLCTRNEQAAVLNAALVECVKDVFTKPFRVLVDLFQVCERDAKYKLKGDRKYNALELAEMIRTEEGFEFLTVIMATSRRPIPRWWKVVAPLKEAADIRTMQMAAQRRIKKVLGDALDADRNITAAIATADALAVQDPDFARPYADAVCSVARVSYSAMAQTKTRR